MRLALVSLIAFTGLAPLAQAQTAAPADATTAAPTPPAASPPPSAPAPATPAPPSAAPAAAPTPAPNATPPGPPPPPTDPTAIAVLNTLEKVCIPAANGGDLAQIAKANGYRKSGENFVYKQPGYQLTILAPGSNPTQCHVDIVHAFIADTPAKEMVVALHNWAAVSRSWTLYRNDKTVDAGQEFITRSWEHSGDGKDEALVLTTVRKADDTPTQHNADTSMMIYNVSKSQG